MSESTLEAFSTERMKKEFGKLIKQREAVNVLMENFKTHPDYASRSLEPPSVKMNYLLSHLKGTYNDDDHKYVKALFGKEPMALEGQYINVQMLYQVTEEKKLKDPQAAQEDEQKAEQDKKKEFYDARITSYEEIFSKKEPLAVEKLFTPAQQLLTNNQKVPSETKPNLPPNFILLQGRAGIGKTTFVTFVTREWALGRLWPEYSWVFSLRFRDLPSLTANDEKEKIWGLEDWIFQTYFVLKMKKEAFQALWDWLIEPALKNKKALFILDGYDEAPTYHPCKKALRDLLSSDTPKIVTSRPYGLSDLPQDRRELEVVGFIDDNVEKYINLYFENEQNKATSIIAGLKPSSILWGSAHIPVTLNALCGVLESEKDIPITLAKLNTMSRLYETLEMSLLERAYRKVSNKEIDHADQLRGLALSDKAKILMDYYKNIRFYLGKLAFNAFSNQRLILEDKEVQLVLKDLDVHPGDLNSTIKQLTDLGLFKRIIDDVTHQENKYEFLHLTFQEYYAGRYLLWQVQQNSPTILEDFAKIKLDPRWQIVLSFAAGAIKDKEQFNLFMRAIAAPQGADMLGNVQLGLMICCTEESWELAKQTGWTNAITQMLQKRIITLRECFKRGELNEISRLPFWVQMLKKGERKYEGQTEEFRAQLTELLADSSRWNVRLSAVEDGYLGQAAFTQELLLLLAKLLADSETHMRDSAAITVGYLGQAAVTQEILLLLAKLLENSDWSVRRSAARVVGNLGQAVATPEILLLLAKLLADSNEYVRYSAAIALGNLGQAAATPEILLLLAKLLADSSSDVRRYAAYAVGKLGQATPEILSLLVKLLADSDEDVRNWVVYTVGKVGKATPEILLLLAKLLADSSSDVRNSAAEAFGKLGKAAATPEILLLLAKLLADSHWHVQCSAVKAVGNLGQAAATPEILLLLANLLVDCHWDVRHSAVKAIGNLGKAAATSEILAQLAKLLADSSWCLQSSAAEAVGNLGQVAATTEILLPLAKLLADSESRVRDSAAKAVGKLGKAAATKEFLAQLAKLLADSDWCVRSSAIKVVGNLGQAAAEPEILAQLAKFWRIAIGVCVAQQLKQ